MFMFPVKRTWEDFISMLECTASHRLLQAEHVAISRVKTV